MTDSDDKLRRAYRQLASEEPSALIDAAILAHARARRSSGIGRWAGPVSIAAVLVLGIGVSLRMQLEQPGVETSAPGGSPEYPLPQSAAPEPPRAEPAQSPAADANLRAVPDAKIKVAPAKPAPRPEMAAPAPEKKEGFRLDRAPASAMAPASPPPVSPPPAAVPAPAAAPAFVPEPPRAAEKERARAPAPAELGAAAAPQSRASASQAPAPPAAREEAMRDSAGALQKKSLNAMEADADPMRELERIAKLREAGRHAEADKALEEFRKRHPDFRIPEAMSERVRPR